MKYHAVCSVMTVAAQIILMSVPKKKTHIFRILELCINITQELDVFKCDSRVQKCCRFVYESV